MRKVSLSITGELQRTTLIENKFAQIIHNRWAIVLRMLGLDGFNGSVTRCKTLTVNATSPLVFTGQIKLGDMHQTVQAFNRLMTALSFFRLFYEEFTPLSSAL